MAKCFLTLLLWIASAVALQQTRKNVLFISLDDVRTELSAYGEHTTITPAIDSLAAKSMVFERAYCQIAVCSPSRTSILTGRRPDSTHAWRNTHGEYWRLYANATSLPQYFKDNGYRTIGIGKIFHPGRSSGRNDIEYSWSLPYFIAFDQEISPDSWKCFENVPDNTFRDGQYTERAIHIIKELKQNRTKGDDTPFFLAVGFRKPHLPMHVPSKYCDLYPPSEIKLAKNPYAPKNMPPIAWNSLEGLSRYPDMNKYSSPECLLQADESINDKKCHVTDSDARMLRRAYYAGISYVDAQIGQVISELEAQGLADDTIIVLWSDHGWKLGEHASFGKYTNFEDDTHVPLMLHVPKVTDAGMRTSALVELVDIFPTLAEVAGLAVPPLCPENSKDVLTCVEGISAAPLLKNPTQDWKKAAFSQFPRPSSGVIFIPGKPDLSMDHEESVMGYAVRTDIYRFVEWYKFNDKSGKAHYDDIWGTELYHHGKATKSFDDENENIAGDANMADKVKELRKMLHSGWREVAEF